MFTFITGDCSPPFDGTFLQNSSLSWWPNTSLYLEGDSVHYTTPNHVTGISSCLNSGKWSELPYLPSEQKEFTSLQSEISISDLKTRVTSRGTTDASMLTKLRSTIMGSQHLSSETQSTVTIRSSTVTVVPTTTNVQPSESPSESATNGRDTQTKLAVLIKPNGSAAYKLLEQSGLDSSNKHTSLESVWPIIAGVTAFLFSVIVVVSVLVLKSKNRRTVSLSSPAASPPRNSVINEDLSTVHSQTSEPIYETIEDTEEHMNTQSESVYVVNVSCHSRVDFTVHE